MLKTLILEQARVVNSDLLGLSLLVEVSGASEDNSHGKDAVAEVGVAVSLSSTLGGVHDHFRLRFGHVNNIAVFLVEPLLELVDVLLGLLIDLSFELGHKGIDICLELLLLLDLLSAEVDSHVVKDALDVVGGLADLLLAELHGFFVLFLLELLP